MSVSPHQLRRLRCSGLVSLYASFFGVVFVVRACAVMTFSSCRTMPVLYAVGPVVSVVQWEVAVLAWFAELVFVPIWSEWCHMQGLVH